MREAGISKAEIKAYLAEATAADHDHLLATTMRFDALEFPDGRIVLVTLLEVAKLPFSSCR